MFALFCQSKTKALHKLTMSVKHLSQTLTSTPATCLTRSATAGCYGRRHQWYCTSASFKSPEFIRMSNQRGFSSVDGFIHQKCPLLVVSNHRISTEGCYVKHYSLKSGETAGSSDPRARKDFNKKRIIAFLGAFAVLHLCVLWARYYHRKQKELKTSENVSLKSDTPLLYVDPDLGKSAKMISYRSYLLPIFVKDCLDEIKTFEVNNNDIFVSSFPKSGTTWVQEMVYLIETAVNLEAAKETNIEQRFPYLEFVYPGIKEIAKQTSPRRIKTHLPWTMMPDDVRAGKGKVIYIARNPKDVSVSYFHYIRMMSEVSYKGKFTDFFPKFINGNVAYGPWWSHVQDYWEHRDDPNVLFLTYEDLHQDIAGCIEKVASFLGRTLTPLQVSEIAKHCSFAQMKANPSVNYTWWDDLGLRHKNEAQFMRKGTVGDWQNYYTAAMSGEVDTMCQHTLQTRGLQLRDRL